MSIQDFKIRPLSNIAWETWANSLCTSVRFHYIDAQHSRACQAVIDGKFSQLVKALRSGVLREEGITQLHTHRAQEHYS